MAVVSAFDMVQIIQLVNLILLFFHVHLCARTFVSGIKSWIPLSLSAAWFSSVLEWSYWQQIMGSNFLIFTASGLEYSRHLKKTFSLLLSRDRIFNFLLFLKIGRLSTSVVSLNCTYYWVLNIFFSYLAHHSPCYQTLVRSVGCSNGPAINNLPPH